MRHQRLGSSASTCDALVDAERHETDDPLSLLPRLAALGPLLRGVRTKPVILRDLLDLLANPDDDTAACFADCRLHIAKAAPEMRFGGRHPELD